MNFSAHWYAVGLVTETTVTTAALDFEITRFAEAGGPGVLD